MRALQQGQNVHEHEHDAFELEQGAEELQQDVQG
jgi:hypothetical protein